jgi:threonine/homoserine/homoserine lactone efflux protein
MKMDITFLQRGLVIGFSIAAPVGPISLLCMRRTLAEGRLSGIVSGLGAATADALFGCVAGFGLTIISNILIDQQAWLRLTGGLFLCYLGIRTLLARPAKQVCFAGGSGLIGAYASTLFLTLTNPMTILSFAAFFAGTGLANTGGSFVSISVSSFTRRALASQRASSRGSARASAGEAGRLTVSGASSPR